MAQSFRGRTAMLGLYAPTKAPWYPDLRAQLLSFPAGKFSARDSKVRRYRAFGMTLPPCLCGGPLLFDLPAIQEAAGVALRSHPSGYPPEYFVFG
jgi:hypothetical protein